MKNNQKLFVIKKYVMAASASQSIRKERSSAVDDVWVDEEWRRANTPLIGQTMGFNDKKHDT